MLIVPIFICVRPDELEAQAVQEEIGSAVGDGAVGSESGNENK
jgi:hypothetical protein